jgi:hypothetical protein
MLGFLDFWTVTVSHWVLRLLVVIPSTSFLNSSFSATETRMLGFLVFWKVTVSRWLLYLLVVIPSSSSQNSLLSAAERHACFEFWFFGQLRYLVGSHVFLL